MKLKLIKLFITFSVVGSYIHMCVQFNVFIVRKKPKRHPV